MNVKIAGQNNVGLLCVIVNTMCDYVGGHSPTKYGVHLIIS